MTIVLTHVQRLILRRLAALNIAPTFIQLVPNRTRETRKTYFEALTPLVKHGFVHRHVRGDTEVYVITMLGRRELYPRAFRGVE